MMSGIFTLRDWIIKPRSVLNETDLKKGYKVLDYGCGPGSYSLEAADLVGFSGEVFAIDINPFALKRVEERASRKGIKNIHTILTDCATGLESNSIDVVLLYDIYHIFEHPDRILEELHRILKPHCILSFSDHHMDEKSIVSGVTQNGLFSFLSKGKMTYTFVRN